MTYIEGGGGGPSKLDERLEAFKDPETGHIILTQEEAKDTLLASLLGEYRRQVAKGALLNQTNPKIEALVQIAEAQGPEDSFDFTGTVESIKKGRTERIEEREFKKRIKEISTSSESPQAEI
ncbi:hypothetical protein E3I18_00285 [Candidatus Woesebacteria bacterium]|nr:MAG: hypothetical protein E3I18_00285 [Candidatus Woesebacteria bacterium]